MSRAKLKALGLDLPILPTSTVGSFPKPDYLTEARAKATRNAITRQELDRLERQATEFWKRMGQGKDGAPPEFLSTHPSDDTRIKQIQGWMPEAMKVYEANAR